MYLVFGLTRMNRSVTPQERHFWHEELVLRLAFLLLVFRLFAAGATPEELYASADRFAEAGNWTAAGPLFAEAERGFEMRGDRRMMLYARFGRLRRAVETGSYDAYLKEVELALAEPAVDSDLMLR